jgi:hypothetical protein
LGANTALKTARIAGNFFNQLKTDKENAYRCFNKDMKTETDLLIEDSMFLFKESYTEMNSKFGFWPRRTATDFEPASIAQLIQVVLLPRRQSLAQIQGAFLPNSQISNSFRYNSK